MMIIKANNIKNEEIVKVILDSLIPVNKYLDEIEETSIEYEDICESIQEQFCEIYEAMNISLMRYNSHNIFIVDTMNFRMWDYLKGEVNFDDLLVYLKKQYSSRIK